MYIIRGFKHNQGEYKGRSYENYNLFCTMPNDEGVTGESVATIKVKPSILNRVFPNSNDVIGCAVDFSYKQMNFDGIVSAVVSDIKILKKGDKT